MKPSECSSRFPLLFQWKLREPLGKQYGVFSWTWKSRWEKRWNGRCDTEGEQEIGEDVERERSGQVERSASVLEAIRVLSNE